MADSKDFAINRNITLAFPTLLGRFQIEGCEGINAELLKVLLEKENSGTSENYANLGGWHSSGDLLEWPGSQFLTFRNWVTQALTTMVQATGQLPEVQGRTIAPGKFRLSAWGNISRRGNYHRMHNHPGSAWSGVYYVTDLQTAHPLEGTLELYDPRPHTEMVDVPGSPYGQRIQINPRAGLMVVFPSWLYHFVHPFTSDDTRVSIAFNASWVTQG